MAYAKCSLILGTFFFAQSVYAQIQAVPLPLTCSNDFTSSVQSIDQHCLRLLTQGDLQNKPDELVIYLHGDYGVGGSSYMRHFATPFLQPKRIHIAMIRPGYFDDEGHFSTGNDLGIIPKEVAGRLDSYTPENIQIIGQAIRNLKNHYKPKRLLLIGHSGGAAIASLILNAFPHLADGALLINCPCDIQYWRPGWVKSLSPIDHIQHIPAKTIIHSLAGASDDNVWPELSKRYTEALLKKNISAKFYLGIGMQHNLNGETEKLVKEHMQVFFSEFSPKP